MSSRDSDDRARAKLLSDALRAVRKIRPAKTEALADALGLSVRGYQNFEAGGGALSVKHVMNFGAAIDCDPLGVAAAVQIGQPQFAAWVAHNKAMLAFAMTLEEFVEETGDAIAHLDTTELVSCYRAMFKDLSAKALQAKSAKDDWLARLGRTGRGDEPFEPDGSADPRDPDDEPS
ncbi:hypothetical protein [Caulobacter hibisci]|uniref:HTH cro/C1-type domain-containing protein n=1 Tax=Caulobacter hibisci TaxID=2035993 RepID=A0ABS0SZZ2_9CAUL|nr:hypothetical protein [Caulobacter hibisci]MBI1685174.1 hypothetical protein [Caulobacter hibisci]